MCFVGTTECGFGELQVVRYINQFNYVMTSIDCIYASEWTRSESIDDVRFVRCGWFSCSAPIRWDLPCDRMTE